MTRKLTLLFIAGGAHVVGDKPKSKEEVAIATGIDPATLLAPPDGSTVIDVSEDTPVPAAFERGSGDTPFQKKFDRKITSMSEKPITGVRKTSRFRKPDAPTGALPLANPALESKG
jgi:hypothetical protein